MKYFSMFSGIGGFELGIERATDGKWECIGYSEIDKYSIQTYKKHFSNHKDYGNARNINPKELPDFDLLCGGFPCQSFSIAGKRKGFQDTRGTLFHEICRVVAEKKPRFLFLENVKGLLSADNGRCFATIISSLDELGYNVEWQVLNSKNFGVPQNRERVFIIGHLRGKGGQQVFPLRKVSSEIKETDGERIMIDVYNRKLRDECPTLSQPEHNSIRVAYAIDANYWKGTSEQHFLEKKTRQLVYTPKVRRLTPTECERLQGFPDGWTKYGINEHGKEVEQSDTQRYKQLGNAVTVNVIEAIIRRFA